MPGTCCIAPGRPARQSDRVCCDWSLLQDTSSSSGAATAVFAPCSTEPGGPAARIHLGGAAAVLLRSASALQSPASGEDALTPEACTAAGSITAAPEAWAPQGGDGAPRRQAAWEEAEWGSRASGSCSSSTVDRGSNGVHAVNGSSSNGATGPMPGQAARPLRKGGHDGEARGSRAGAEAAPSLQPLHTQPHIAAQQLIATSTRATTSSSRTTSSSSSIGSSAGSAHAPVVTARRRAMQAPSVRRTHASGAAASTTSASPTAGTRVAGASSRRLSTQAAAEAVQLLGPPPRVLPLPRGGPARHQGQGHGQGLAAVPILPPPPSAASMLTHATSSTTISGSSSTVSSTLTSRHAAQHGLRASSGHATAPAPHTGVYPSKQQQQERQHANATTPASAQRRETLLGGSNRRSNSRSSSSSYGTGVAIAASASLSSAAGYWCAGAGGQGQGNGVREAVAGDQGSALDLEESWPMPPPALCQPLLPGGAPPLDMPAAVRRRRLLHLFPEPRQSRWRRAGGEVGTDGDVEGEGRDGAQLAGAEAGRSRGGEAASGRAAASERRAERFAFELSVAHTCDTPVPWVPSSTATAPPSPHQQRTSQQQQHPATSSARAPSLDTPSSPPFPAPPLTATTSTVSPLTMGGEDVNLDSPFSAVGQAQDTALPYSLHASPPYVLYAVRAPQHRFVVYRHGQYGKWSVRPMMAITGTSNPVLLGATIAVPPSSSASLRAAGSATGAGAGQSAAQGQGYVVDVGSSYEDLPGPVSPADLGLVAQADGGTPGHGGEQHQHQHQHQQQEQDWRRQQGRTASNIVLVAPFEELRCEVVAETSRPGPGAPLITPAAAAAAGIPAASSDAAAAAPRPPPLQFFLTHTPPPAAALQAFRGAPDTAGLVAAAAEAAAAAEESAGLSGRSGPRDARRSSTGPLGGAAARAGFAAPGAMQTEGRGQGGAQALGESAAGVATPPLLQLTRPGHYLCAAARRDARWTPGQRGLGPQGGRGPGGAAASAAGQSGPHSRAPAVSPAPVAPAPAPAPLLVARCQAVLRRSVALVLDASSLLGGWRVSCGNRDT